MLRKALTLVTVTCACAAPAFATGSGHRSGIYKGKIRGGGRITLTISGSSVTAINVTGSWSCDNGVVPINYTYSLRSQPGHPALISAAGSFKGNHLKFASPDLYNNMGKYSGSGSVSGTVRGTTVTGSVSVSGGTPDSVCSGGGRYTATLTG
ncbi:MAG: hypothetical protein ACYDHH_16270 [Solirubrobacteraceae bacterium]